MTRARAPQPPAAGAARFPAEWEPHAATWLGYPHNATDWPGKLAPIPWVYGEIMRHLLPGERVNLIVPGAAHEQQARRILAKVGADAMRVDFRRFPSNRGWTRDSGPLFVRTGDQGTLAVARFRFSAWAKYRDWKKDDALPERAAKALKIPQRPIVHANRPVVLEGGSIDVNGAGSILTTEECLLHPTVQVRNPGFARADYEAIFARELGAPNTIWLGNGIVGDDTHGHVDDLARFVNPNTVVLAQERNPRDANYQLLNHNRERLEGARLESGARIDVVPLPMPAPVMFDGRRLPASYANFYLANAAVLVPTFNDPQDRIALGILAELFRDRPVIGIHAVDLVWGLGTLHCLTQQQPVAEMTPS